MTVTDLGMNERAWTLADRLVARAAELRTAVRTLATARASWTRVPTYRGFRRRPGAGRTVHGRPRARRVRLARDRRRGLAGCAGWTDHPAESCMASQYAGWAINPAGFFAMGSGPLRAKARVERELFSKLGYAEDGPRGVLVLEGRDLPDR